MSLPSLEYLREILRYDPQTGAMTWIKRRVHKHFSHLYAGRPAGRVNRRDGYIQIGIDNKRYSLHRLAWFMTHGSEPDGCIDHINGDKLDNRLTNLRVVTPAENAKNQPLPSRNKSGVMGVCRVKATGRWRAQIGVNGRQTCLGEFEDKNAAIAARKEAERRFGFHENHGRIIMSATPPAAESQD